MSEEMFPYEFIISAECQEKGSPENTRHCQDRDLKTRLSTHTEVAD